MTQSRLLTDEEMIALVEQCLTSDRLIHRHDWNISQFQDAKTAHIVRQEVLKEVEQVLKDKGMRTIGFVRHRMVWQCVELVQALLNEEEVNDKLA